MIVTQKTIISFDLRKEYQQAMRFVTEHSEWFVDDTSSVGLVCWTETTTMVDLKEQNDDTV